MKFYDCVIIDSGVNISHRQLKKHEIHGLAISLDDHNCMQVSDQFQDKIGHGTAIYSIIKKNVPSETSLLNINIFNNRSDNVDEMLLVAALQYVNENIQCKVINISMGIKMCANVQELYSICKKISDKGILILSAFDNVGAISYPAAFDCVIGVDSSEDCLRVSDYEYIENSVINVRAKGGYHKVLWLEPEYAIGYGSSYSCAYMTANVLNMLSQMQCVSLKNLKERIRTQAINIYHSTLSLEDDQNDFFVPKDAVIFPVNKETHNLIAQNSLISCNIYLVADLRQSGHVGKKIHDIIQYKALGKIGLKTVVDFDSLDWEAPFDTVILGHIEVLGKLTKRNLLPETIQACIKYHKNLICLDNASNYSNKLLKLKNSGCKVYFPRIEYQTFPCNQFGKLYLVNKPVVCVAGTSSSQGKFSLQLSLREKFINAGYQIGQLGTEPTSLLYGMDEVFHYGYAVSNYSCFEETVMHVNYLMHRIDEKEPDIILTGVQSGLAPYAYDNISYLTHRQMEVLTGIMPDTIILCVNPQDSLSFIKRTILSVENFLNTTVLCCALYPMKYGEQFHIYSKKEYISVEEKLQLIKQISTKLGIPVFAMDDEGVQNIFDLIIDYFSDNSPVRES